MTTNTNDDIPERGINTQTNLFLRRDIGGRAGQAEAGWRLFFVGHCSLRFVLLALVFPFYVDQNVRTLGLQAVHIIKRYH